VGRQKALENAEGELADGKNRRFRACKISPRLGLEVGWDCERKSLSCDLEVLDEV
jgi:hypothetical protein